MRLTDLTEKSKQSVTLFRGDADMVDEFEMDKTDARALVGQGVYLTTSFDVAKDYTIKGTEVLYRSEEGESEDPRAFVYNQFFNRFQPRSMAVAQAMFWAVRSEVATMGRIFDEEIATIIGTGREARHHQRYNELLQWKRAASDYVESYGMAAGEKVLNEYLRGIYDAEYAEYKKTFKNTRMLTTVLGELVIIPEDKLGHVSRFRAPATYLDDKFYPVDSPMDDEMVQWIVKFLQSEREDFDSSSTPVDLRYNDPERGAVRADSFDDWIEKFKAHGSPYAWGGFDIGGEGDNPTLMQFAVGTHHGQNFSDTIWDALRGHLQEIGYSGLHYEGGNRTGTDTFAGGSPVKHDAYVLWDENEVKGLRVGSKEVGVNSTDQRLFSRFKFGYVIKPITKVIDENRAKAKSLRKNLKNVDQIEAAVQQWLKTGELQKKMEEAYASTNNS